MARQNDGDGPVAAAVVGDSTVDWITAIPIAAGVSAAQTRRQDLQLPVQIRAQTGGAALLHRGVAAAIRRLDEKAVTIGPTPPPRSISDPSFDQLTRTYAIWRPFPIRSDRSDLVWRMYRFLGVTPPSGEPECEPFDGVAPACLVVDDGNLGFRSSPESWPAYVREPDAAVRHVLLKMSNPLVDGPLWDELTEHYGDVMTIYCSVDSLREEYASIGQSLSWERSAFEIVQAVRSRPSFARARRLVVSLGFSGAVIIEQDSSARLVFDPRSQEGDWERQHPGIVVGVGTCIVTALAAECFRRPEEPDWVGGVQSGLLAARILHDSRVVASSVEDHPEFWIDTIVDALAGERTGDSFRSIDVSEDSDWRISSIVSSDDVRSMAASIVLHGDEAACRDIPAERIGAWTSIDRVEIESMRSARAIAREYLLQDNPTRPLSLAVFGPPGSGKSFAIKQMTRNTGSIPQQLSVLEFNLSQLRSPDDLPQAFQAVRDCAVERKLPLVFWDEFDTALEGSELGWVSRFLAPMQDGVFTERGINRPIGPAIFIFAGGTHATMASFKSRAMQLPEAKATDFLSRLRGYLDILGPNPMSSDDRSYVLRRALLLRGLLSSKAPGVRRQDRIDIDPGVLRAFLDISTYVHGARSMESIIDMSSLSGKLRYERSSLPAMNQLGLHVDPDEFLALVHQES
jgi:hypothetical protein